MVASTLFTFDIYLDCPWYFLFIYSIIHSLINSLAHIII